LRLLIVKELTADSKKDRAMSPHVNDGTIAILPWGDVFEDYLDTIGVSLEAFCNEMNGGWLFGYVRALQVAGLRPIVVIFSAQVTSPTWLMHAPTGATIWVLPASRIFRAIRRLILKTESESGKTGSDRHRAGRIPVLRQWLKRVLPYLSTPLALLERELHRQGCSAIICQEYEDVRFDACTLLGWLTGLPVFASFHGGVRERGYLGLWIRSFLLKSSAGLIIAPGSEAHRVRGQYKVPHAKVARIFNPLDLRQYPILDRNETRALLQIPREAEIVVWHGRISIHHKGLDILLAAWEILRRACQGRDLRLLLVGTGEDADEFGRRLTASP
jgi:starch synthase